MRLDPNNNAHYDLITAMRGPDDGDERAKVLFTSIIRWYVMDQPDQPRATNPVRPLLNTGVGAGGCLLNTPDNARAYFKDHPGNIEASRHFLSHARAAFIQLDIKFPRAGLASYFNWAIQLTNQKDEDDMRLSPSLDHNKE